MEDKSSNESVSNDTDQEAKLSIDAMDVPISNAGDGEGGEKLEKEEKNNQEQIPNQKEEVEEVEQKEEENKKEQEEERLEENQSTSQISFDEEKTEQMLPSEQSSKESSEELPKETTTNQVFSSSGGDGEKMDTISDSPQQEGINGEGTPAQKKRNRSRDDLSLSPDMTKTGKRQRKTNSLYSGFAIDKKTSHILETEQVHVTPVEVVPVAPADPSSLGKREVLLTPLDAQVKAKKLPKGYAYEPVVAPIAKEDILPAKRERKKVALSDYVDEKQPAIPIKPNKKQKPNKPKKQQQQQQQQQTPKKLSSPVAVVQSSPVPDEVTAQMLKKQELENQLSALTQQLAMVSQTLETKTKQVQALEKLEKNDVVVKEEKAHDSLDEGGDMEIALPSGTIVKQKKKQPVPKKVKRIQSVYDRFESDDDLPVVKKSGKRGSGKSRESGVRPQRSTKKKSLANLDEDSEEETIAAPPPPGTVKHESIEDFQVEDHLKGCLKVLLSLRKHHYAWPFNVPVDPVALQLPDYHEIIKHPMDLGTVLERMKNSKYPTVEDFGEDVRLVFKNAVTYNQPGSDICIMANTLANNFEKQFSKLVGKPATAAPTPPKQVPVVSETVPVEVEAPPAPVEDPNVKTKAEMANTINELRDSMKFVRQEISKLRREKAQSSSPAHAPRARAPLRPKEEPLREMTFEEKRQLSVNINQLQPENLGRVVQIIHQRMPNLAQNSPDEIEIDIDALDTGTLRALEKYVKGCLAKKKGKRSTPLPAHLQAQQTAQNTSKSIQDVKKKLKELSDKSTGAEKKSKKKKEEDTEDVDIDDDAPARTYPSIEITKDKGSSSSSSSDSSSSSSDTSSSDSEDEKKQEESGSAPAPVVASVSVVASVPVTTEATQSVSAPLPSSSVDSADKPEQDQKDATLPSPEREATPMEGVTQPQAEASVDTKAIEAESPQILPAAVKKEVELKNLDSWANLGMDSTTDSSENQKKDETWSQFQNRDLQNKQREKEREEQQEKEKREKAEREAERRRQDEQRARELAEQEQKKQQEEEETKLAAQRELAAKRAAERKAREQLSANSINMLDQSVIMSSFEMGASAPESLLKLKEKDQKEEEEM